MQCPRCQYENRLGQKFRGYPPQVHQRGGLARAVVRGSGARPERQPGGADVSLVPADGNA